jgi:hypothetical protein
MPIGIGSLYRGDGNVPAHTVNYQEQDSEGKCGPKDAKRLKILSKVKSFSSLSLCWENSFLRPG